MKRRREYTDYLRDMLDAAEKADRFVEEVSFEDFQNNDEKVFAVIRAIDYYRGSSQAYPPCTSGTLSRCTLAGDCGYAR